LSDERIRVRLKNATGPSEAKLAWATFAGPSETDPAGYVLEWDDGWRDYPNVRWQFEGTGIFDLERVE